LKEISNKNNELLNFEIVEEELFELLTKIAEYLYKNSSLILEKKEILQFVKDFSIQDNKRKYFLDYLLKTFFIQSE
jgi:predicted metal-binding transcription factor (methanogenesis marker protein 9)